MVYRLRAVYEVGNAFAGYYSTLKKAQEAAELHTPSHLIWNKHMLSVFWRFNYTAATINNHWEGQQGYVGDSVYLDNNRLSQWNIDRIDMLDDCVLDMSIALPEVAVR